MNWCKLNEIVEYPDKVQLIFFGLKEDHELCMDIHGDIIKISNTVKLLGVTIDSKLRFNEHIKTICQKTKIRLKLFQGLQGTWNPKRLAYFITHLYQQMLITAKSSGCSMEKRQTNDEGGLTQTRVSHNSYKKFAKNLC